MRLLRRLLLGGVHDRRFLGDGSAEDEIEVSESGGVIALELLMVQIVSTSAAITRNKMERVEGEVVAGMHIRGLQHAHAEPEEEEHNVVTEEESRDEKASTESDGLQRMSILSSEGERSGVVVMHFVDEREEPVNVENSVENVVVEILVHDAQQNLPNIRCPMRNLIVGKRNAHVGVVERKSNEEHGGLHQKLIESDVLDAFKNFHFRGLLLLLQLVLVESRDERVDDGGQREESVHDKVEDERTVDGDLILSVVVGQVTPSNLEPACVRTSDDRACHGCSCIKSHVVGCCCASQLKRVQKESDCDDGKNKKEQRRLARGEAKQGGRR